MTGGPGREVEFKIRVDGEGAFMDLARAIGPTATLGAPIRQVNHFFDTPRFALRARGCALRLRDEEGRYVLTAKGRTLDSTATAAGLAVRAEEEAEVPADVAQAILRADGSPLEALLERLPRSPLLDKIADVAATESLLHAGTFTNLRRKLGPVTLTPADHQAAPQTVTFELDRTELPGGRIDHEIEVELTDVESAEDLQPYRAALERLLAGAGLPWQPSKSKAARFFQALADQST